MGSYSVCLSTLVACFGFGGSGLYTWVGSSLLDINENHDSPWCNQPHTSTIRSNQYTLEQAPLLSLCLLLPCNYLTVAWLSVCFNLCPILLQIINCSYQRLYKCTCRTYLFVIDVFPFAEFGVGQICSILSRMSPLMRAWRVSSPSFVTCMACGAWTNTSLSCTKARKSHCTGKR